MYVRPVTHVFSAIRRRMLWLVLLLVCVCFSCAACEVHDYWMIPSSLTVDSDQNINYSTLEEPLTDDLFMRYQLDYVIENKSTSAPSEVVVIGTSYVNSFERAVGHKVWHLEPGETQEGVLMSTQLQYGNALNVSLACCGMSECMRNDVLCPQEEEAPEAVAAFCYSACEARDACIEKCPASASCEQFCKESAASDIDQCIQKNCTTPGQVSTCRQVCRGDAACYDACEPYAGCVTKCTSNAAACFKNCLSTWSQCTDAIFEPQATDIPCALCGGPEDEACLFNETKQENPILTSHSGNTYACDIDCSAYPEACVTGCETLFEDDSGRMHCLDRCLMQHLYWCNDFTIPTDFVDANVTQPCCFSNFCQAEFTGIVKTFEVQCFNDASCSSNHYCSDEGVCVSSGAGGCSVLSSRATPPYFLFVLALLSLLAARKRRGSS